MTSEHAGWVVVYRADTGNRPDWPNGDLFITQTSGGEFGVNGTSVDDAHKFTTPDMAFLVSARFATPEKRFPACVVRVERQTRLVLCGESFADINQLLKKLQLARPSLAGDKPRE